MGRYRKIDVRIWNDAKFRALSDDGKMLFMLVMTHPNQTMLGAMRTNTASLAADLGWPIERLSKALAEALAKDMAKHDGEASFLWLPNFLKYNRPESPNVVKAWPDAYELLPECAMKTLVWSACERCVEGMGEGFRKAFKSLAKEYALSGAGTGAGTGDKTGGASATPHETEILEAQTETEDTHADEIADAENNHGQQPQKVRRSIALDVAESHLDPAECARKMFEHLAITAPAKTLTLAADAIRMLAVQLRGTPHGAMLVIRKRAELAIAHGETVNAFWFEDSRWKGEAYRQQQKPDPFVGKRVPTVEEIEADRAREFSAKPETAPEGVDTALGERIWNGMNKALKNELGAQSYETWIRPIKPLGALNGELYLQIPSPDFAHVRDRYEIAKFLPAGVGTIHMLSATGVAA